MKVLKNFFQETATNIAYSCQLFSSDQNLIEINEHSKEATLERMDEILNDMRTARTSEDDRSIFGSRFSMFTTSMASLRSEPEQMKKYALIINGPTLSFATGKVLQASFCSLM